ncbi:MAG: LysE family translocator [Rhizobiaceae bacterium]|jgi:threonine/homoserine/homoserine lactone efflux protein|nr:LysE family translocator [Rhizobiaceae bacterium]
MTEIAAASLFSFALASLLIELTPGPNMSYLAIATLKDGRRAGLLTVAGVALGLLAVGFVAALGLNAIIANSPPLYDGLRMIGLLFFLYLAFEAWQGPKADAGADISDGSHFMRGFLTNALNPKAATFYLAVLPRFVDPAGDVIRQTLTLTLIYVAVATLVHALIVIGAAQARPFLDGPNEQIARRVMAGLLVAVAVWFAISTAR